MADSYLNNLGSGWKVIRGHAPLTLTISPDVSEFSISPTEYFTSRPEIHNLIAGTIVFRPTQSSTPTDLSYETLLLRRAPSDSFPLKWEIPGGTADPSVDRSIIEVAVRELLEETQLRPRRLLGTVGLGLPHGVPNLTLAGEAEDAKMDAESNVCLLRVKGLIWAVVTFIADIEDEQAKVVLQEDEHIEWAWVTELEVQKRKFGKEPEKELEFVSEAMRLIVAEGFGLRKKMAAKCGKELPSRIVHYQPPSYDQHAC
ncbi:hypothetical protein F4859DRAFT_497113 [Xylaria cf. heliscus]|nr:hypothetical protein F4859DRAFT_497113 [Xylaria cf. heliscus]